MRKLFLLVTAPKGKPCPVDGITIGDEPVRVANDHLHRAHIADGSLIEVTTAAPRPEYKKRTKNRSVNTSKPEGDR